MAISLTIPSTMRQATKDFLESRHWPRRPQVLNFEITAACDARCIHCPRLEMHRPKRIMPFPLFQKIVDECAQAGVPFLCPNGYGEICTLPVDTLTNYFEFISSRSHPFKLIVNTNGHRLDQEKAYLFIKHKVHTVNVTIDGATAQTAESIRVNLKFDQVEANVRQLINIRNAMGLTYPKIRVGMIAMPQTIAEQDLFFERWAGVADYVGMGGFSSRLASVTYSETGEKPGRMKASQCVLPFRDLNIWADGKAVLCCEDWNESHIVGDFNFQSLNEIWTGEALTEARRKHMQKRGADLTICSLCNNWQSPGPGTRLWA